MNDLRYFRVGIRCAEHTDTTDVVDKLSRSCADFRASGEAALILLGLFVGSACNDADELLASLKSLETEAGAALLETGNG